jgi:hypothetical protein
LVLRVLKEFKGYQGMMVSQVLKVLQEVFLQELKLVK